MAEEELGPLPAGRHGFSREQVAHNQRERLLAGVATAVAERGYSEVTIAHITKAAKVSRRVFYENFESKDECFLAAFDTIVGHIHELVDEAVEGVSDWPHQAMAATRETVVFLAAEPDLARLCLVEAQSAGPEISTRFHSAVGELVGPLRRGRNERPAARELPPSTETSTIGALISLASRKVVAGEADRLGELLPDLVQFILAPYLGPEEAERLAAAAA